MFEQPQKSKLTVKEVTEQGYNPDTYFGEHRTPTPEGLPITFTRKELEDQGYIADNHPAYEVNVARADRLKRLEAQGVSVRAAKDAVLLADAAIGQQLEVDMRTGVVLTPEEVTAHQQGEQ